MHPIVSRIRGPLTLIVVRDMFKKRSTIRDILEKQHVASCTKSLTYGRFMGIKFGGGGRGGGVHTFSPSKCELCVSDDDGGRPNFIHLDKLENVLDRIMTLISCVSCSSKCPWSIKQGIGGLYSNLLNKVIILLRRNLEMGASCLKFFTIFGLCID